MPNNKNFFENGEFENILRRYIQAPASLPFTDRHQAIFKTIKGRLLDDYYFINNLSAHGVNDAKLSKETLERIHHRTVEIFKENYPNVRLPENIINYISVSYEEILNDLTDEKKFKSTYFEVDEDQLYLKLLGVKEDYGIDQTDYFVIVVSELSINDQKRKIQLAYDINTGVCVGTPEMAHRLYFEKGIVEAHLLNPSRKVANLGVHTDGTWSGWAANTFRHFKLGDKITENMPNIIENVQQSKMAAFNFVQQLLMKFHSEQKNCTQK